MKTSMSSPPQFTYQWYEYFLDHLERENYAFSNFKDAISAKPDDRHFVILRHDVDFDTEKALAMARFESEKGISSTYFFLMSSSHYNVLEKEARRDIEQILRLGHKLGLHFDTAAYPESSSAIYLNDMCVKEARILGHLFDADISAVSFHRPPDFVLTGDTSFCSEYPHTYQTVFTKDMTYLSDSRAMWKYGDPIEKGLVAEHVNLHILIHPIWWNNAYKSGNEVLNENLNQKCIRLNQSFKYNCQIFQDLKQ